MALRDALDFVVSYRKQNPRASKQQIAAAAVEALGLVKHRSVYACDEYAIRFSVASGSSFSNVVLSLSALRQFDDVPFVVVILRPASTEFLLANTTFLKKISHSSHQLRADNVRGSFLGHDILREHAGLANEPENFDHLFACHQEFTWGENLARLVEATGNIAPTGQRFEPTTEQRDTILAAPRLAADVSERERYAELKQEFDGIVQERAAEILEHAKIDNVNQRGNLIEQSITGGINEHNLADMIRRLDDEVSFQIEIKTKLMDRASSPKAYNVDKALRTLAQPNILIVFLFVGVNPSTGTVTSSTVSIFDRTVLEATRVQFHWAGRNSRGVTQLTGDLSQLFSAGYNETIDVDRAKQFLSKLLEG